MNRRLLAGVVGAALSLPQLAGCTIGRIGTLELTAQPVALRGPGAVQP